MYKLCANLGPYFLMPGFLLLLEVSAFSPYGKGSIFTMKWSQTKNSELESEESILKKFS